MKHFFYVIIGGISAIACGLVLAFVGQIAWHSISPRLAGLNLSYIASAIISQPADGTAIAGFKRTVNYSASEEEDLMTAATLSLPQISAVKDVTATAYIIEDLNTGTVVAESNENKLLPIASLTKLVTAEVAKRLIDNDQEITITKNIMSTYGNTAEFRMGETFRAADLYYPLMMVSSNDAAEAFAQTYGRARFISAMNDFVRSIGAYRTIFSDPSGLSADNRSTATDLVTIMNWLRLHDPELIALTLLKTKTVRVHTWVNPTHFLNWSTYRGGKNGYTDEADRTAVTLFQMKKDGDIYAIVVLGSEVRDADLIKLLAKIKA